MENHLRTIDRRFYQYAEKKKPHILDFFRSVSFYFYSIHKCRRKSYPVNKTLYGYITARKYTDSNGVMGYIR